MIQARHPETDDEFRQQLNEWVRANGIDPGDVPVTAHMSRTEDDRLTFKRVVRSELTGTVMLDPNQPNTALIERASVPMLVEPPKDVATWLFVHEQFCPTCKG
jgi:hypothetical protein